MTGITSRIRALAQRHDSWQWQREDFDLCYFVIELWRNGRTERLDDLNPDEGAMFCLFVAEALETE